MRTRALALIAAAAFVASCDCGIPTTKGPAQNGALCTDSARCKSGNCIDGVCCDSTCDATCMACDVPGSEGTCINVPDGTDLRHACGSGTCAGVCDGNAACRYPGSDKICGDKVCAGAFVQQGACDGQGNCGVSSTPCAPYGCRGGVCLTHCSVPLDCAGTATCESQDGGSACVDRLANGSPCGSAGACASNLCVDNVCCDKPCGGSCEACNVAGSAGTCTPIPKGQDPAHECPGVGLCAAKCNGSGACEYATQGTVCEPSQCGAPDSPLNSRVCNGAGVCIDAQVSCGAYACKNNACATNCTTDTDCRSTAYCAGGSCIARKVIGDGCGGNDECASGFCVEGVCCTSACNGPCDTCRGAALGVCAPLGPGATPQTACAAGQACGQFSACPASCGPTAPCLPTHFCAANGTCQPKKVTATACAADGECVSGYCSQGVCCDSNCDGYPCKSCNLTGTVGTCTALPWSATGGCPGLYACTAAGTCASGPCADDRDCQDAGFCGGSAGCVARSPNGTACFHARECASGFCVDGVCCDSACNGAQCQACNLSTSRGACTPIAARQDPFNECTGGLACAGGAASCNASCTSPSQCELGYVCQGTTCVPGKGLGQSCSAGAECASTFCTDGVCCDSACAAPCRSCKLANTVGTCALIPVNSDPEAECAGGNTCGSLPDAGEACRTGCDAGTQCKYGYACQSSACVALKTNGQGCDGGAQCQSGFCTDNVCCNSSCGSVCEACNFASALGACQPMPAGTDPQKECDAGFTCSGASSCGTSCVTDTNCAANFFCNGSACAPKRTNGQPCSSINQCLSNFCADGFCCNTACNGQCESCDQSAALGACTAIPAGSDPLNECPGGLACNGARLCNTTCSGSAQCEAAYYCSAGACVPDQANGGTCTANDQCQSGFCADGFCCNSPCGGACQSCALFGLSGTCSPYTTGTDPENECGLTYCTSNNACFPNCNADTQCKPTAYCNLVSTQCALKKANGSACGAGNECQSGFCIDGVCCNSACGGLCEACNVAGSVGSCTAVPNRQDPANECGATFCNAMRACIAPCAADADCKAGNYCNTGTGMCTPKQVNGTACSAPGNMCVSGFCSDGVCCSSACSGACDICNRSGSVGSCTTLTLADMQTGSPSCSPYYCNGSASCPSACSSQLACVAGYYCTGSPGVCALKKNNGAACTGVNECLSGFCANGYCCNSTCSGQCVACDVTPGTCTNAVAGSDPNNQCGAYVCNGGGACYTSCTVNGQCKSADYCNGSSCVPKKVNGQACGSPAECASGNCADGFCCSTACAGACDECASVPGTCSFIPAQTDGNPSCGDYTCTGVGASCTTSCNVQTQCATTAYCDTVAHTCNPKLNNNANCAHSYECTSACCQSNNNKCGNSNCLSP